MARARLPVLTAALALLAAATGVGTEPVAAQEGAGASESQADTIRDRVLDRIRESTRPLPRDSVVAAAREEDDRRRGDDLSPADSVMEVLLGLPGFERSRYEAKRADFEARDRSLVLSGDEERRARFSGDGAQVEADSSIIYDDRARRVRTTGSTTLTSEQAEPLTSRTLIYDLGQRRGTARESRTEYREGGGNWIVWGELDSVDEREAWMSEARFTSCENEHPHYHFQARNMKVIRDDVLVARSVRLVFDDVPVAWIPFMAQSLGSGRASGLLTPSFSMNDVVRTSEGHQRRLSNLGYYWAMSDYSDAEVAFDWFSNNYIALTSQIRYNWARQFLDGNISFRHFWRDTGQRELTLNTRHNWEYSERTRIRASGRFASSSDFVREQSFDPEEVTRSIDSEGGLNHRFDWGTLSLGANRRQFLSDDRVESTLPTASLSLSTLTLFEAPPAQANWYNNLNLSGNTSFNRRTRGRPAQDSDEFQLGDADRLATEGRVGVSLGLGNFSLSNQFRFEEESYRDVPSDFFSGRDRSHDGLFGEELEGPLDGLGVPGRDLSESEIRWSTGLSYQQNFLGSSTFTPRISVEQRFARSDTIPDALENYVSAPVRTSFGARLRTDVYGFFPGFRNYDAIRHKVTPSIEYSYAPEVTPSDLQRRVFGARESRVRNEIRVGFSQTFEARVRPDEDQDEPSERPAEEVPEGEEGPLQEALDEELEFPSLEDEMEEEGEVGDDDGPRRRPRSEVVQLLGLRTSAVTYDLVEADSLGYFLAGVTTTRLQNQVSSDFLQGLTISMEHDLFEPPSEEGERRRLAPHLSQMNFSFTLNQRSTVAQMIYGLLGLEAPEDEPEEVEDPEDPDADPLDERDPARSDRMVPGDGPGAGMDVGRGEWNARVSYSLRRPRETPAGTTGGQAAQMIRGTMSFQPTDHWNVNWSTSYDVNDGRFVDHNLQLRRDLHDWEANFGFRQTAAGNWSFVFEVRHLANRDLRFDHRLRSRDRGGRDQDLGLPPLDDLD